MDDALDKRFLQYLGFHHLRSSIFSKYGLYPSLEVVIGVFVW
ncbi:hypothetical protein [Paenibacillus farraposensis]